MASVKQVKDERAAPIVATLDLTENELRRVMESATEDKVRAERMSMEALSDVADAATYTLAEKAQDAFRRSEQVGGAE